jgi:hypothetical protein
MRCFSVVYIDKFPQTEYIRMTALMGYGTRSAELVVAGTSPSILLSPTSPPPPFISSSPLFVSIIVPTIVNGWSPILFGEYTLPHFLLPHQDPTPIHELIQAL